MKKLFLFTISFLPALTAAAQNVGIGTTTPQATLEVSGGSGTKAVASLAVLSDPVLIVDTGEYSTNEIDGVTGAWQSFKAVESGYLHSVEIFQGASIPSPAIVSIYRGQGTGGALLGSVLFDIMSPNGFAWRRTPLFNIPINKDETYTIHHSNANQWFYNQNNPYGGGRSNLGASTDFIFRVYTTHYETEYVRVSGNDTPVAWTVSGNEIITGNSLILGNSVISGNSITSGNVGIGTGNSEFRLDVKGDTRFTGNALISGNGIISGRVAVGTSTPRAPLHVVGTSDETKATQIRYFSSGSNSLGHDNNQPWTGQTAGYFQGNVVSSISFIAGASVTFSDERIKKIKGISDGAGDLATLKHIEITDYSMIDSVQHPGTYKKVIAQQVEQHLPQAVSLYRDYIPSIFAEARNVVPDASPGLLKISLATPHQLKAGDELKLMTEKQGEQLVKVAAVNDALTFSVATSDHDWGKVFVYGKKVDDFRVVDYDAISMLNVSATQELARKVEQLEQENQLLRETTKDLRNDVATLKNLLLPEKIAEN